TPACTLGRSQHDLTRDAGGTATGLDFNGNGQFDYLKVGLNIIVDSASYYDYSVSLRDKNGKELGFVSNYAFLNAGSNTLDLYFDGSVIGRNGVDGPYFLS